MIRIIQHRTYNYILSAVLLVLAVAAIAVWGLKFGIDFTGGSLLEVEFAGNRPSVDTIQQKLASTEIGAISVQPAGDRGAILRFRDVDETKHQQVVKQLGEADGGVVTEKRFDSIGPVIGSELKSRALWALGIALFFIVSYIAWAFRKVSRPVASWKYGLAAVFALAHDVLIVVGAFSVLGHYFGIEIDGLFVSAVLTIIGFDVHDTIVVFDRIRENLFRGASSNFEETVNKSVNDTIMRSLNTSFTVLLVLSMLFLFGGESIRYFSLALIIGIIMGTYSSIFVASPIVVDWHRLGKDSGKR